MNAFLIISAFISLLAMILIFFAVPKKLSSSYKLLISVISLLSIGFLLFKVINLSAINKDNFFSPEIASELLKARQNPNDIVAWNDLARAYLLEKEYVHAYMAFSQSEQLDSYVGLGIDEKQARKERLNWLTGLAETRVLAQGGGIDDIAYEFIQRSLEVDNMHPKALWYGGLAEAQRANYSRAKQLWTQLMQQNPPEPLNSVIQNRLDSLKQFLDTEAQAQESELWNLRFKLKISESLLKSQTSESKVYASLRQSKQTPPVIAKSFEAKLWKSQEANLLTLSTTDKITGMASNSSLDWEKPISLSLIWAPDGKVLSADNVRLDIEISSQNLDSVFEYTLE